MKPWRKVGDDELVYKGWRAVYKKKFILNDGKEFIAEIGDPKGMRAAGIIALTADNKVVIARQFRPGPEAILDEIPGGAVDPGEDAKTAALRELEEETGYIADDAIELGHIYKHAWLNTKWAYFLAENCRPNTKGQNLGHSEEVEVDLISIDQLFKNAYNAKMTDTEAVLLAYDKLRSIQKQHEKTD